jgi:hypothetical protein
MNITFPKRNINLKNFFYKIGLKEIYEEGSKKYSLKSKDKRLNKKPYPPDLLDLYYLYELISLNKRITILEYGCGWSTIIINKALRDLKLKLKGKFFSRCQNPYKLISLDNSKKFISISKQRIKKFTKTKQDSNVKFCFSNVNMTKFNGRYCSEYKNHPEINPDFIYVDGPDQFQIKKKINNFSIKSKSMMPMICDILKYEHFLTPGTIILFDGRQSNARFFKSNYQRKWSDVYIKETGQHIFYLNEKALGIINKNQLNFYNYR